MSDIPASAIAALRKQTGAGMLDSKNALVETNGDLEAAKDWLRAKGLAGASKRAGREATQGTVDVVVTPGGSAIVELTCETDFVAKSSDFSGLVNVFANLVAEHGDKNLESQPFDESTIGETITQLGAKLGENIGLGRVVYYAASDNLLDSYKHMQDNRGTIGVLVELAGVDASDPKAREVAHDLALHIASAAPRYITRDEVPSEVVDKERAVLEELTHNEGKPEQAIPKIVEGRLNAFFKDVVLVEQASVKDPKVSIQSLLDGLGANAKVQRFARVKIGEE